MAGGIASSLLSLFLLSATTPTVIAYYAFHFTPSSPSINVAGSQSRSRYHAPRTPTRGLPTMALESQREQRGPIIEQENQLRRDGLGGAERARLAESIAEEFRARVGDVRRTHEAQLEQEKAAHRLALAEQRVELLQDMVPLAAHEAIVASYEKSSSAALEQAAASSAAGLATIAGDFSKRQEALRAQVAERDASLETATTDLRDMSESLSGLKRDVSSLRAALSSHASRAEEARKAIAREIRENEVEPQRRRADAAETGLSELRQAAHGWLAAAHAIKLDAASEARAGGISEGRTQGRLEADLETRAEKLSLRQDLAAAREALSDQMSRSRRDRLALREEVAEARSEAVEMVAAVGAAGAVALTKSREVWMAKGRADGFDAGLAEGKAAGRAEGVTLGRAAAEVELMDRVQAAEEGRATALVASTAASEAEAELREAFSSYVVSAHEQRLRAAAADKNASREVARGLSKELASAREMLASLLQERISEIEVRRDTALGDIAAAATAVDAELPLTLPRASTWPGTAPADVAVAAAEFSASSSFWQECGGNGQ